MEGSNRLYGDVTRLLIVLIFPLSALDKLIHWDIALKQATSSYLPGGAFLLVAAIVLETVGPLLILVRRSDKPAAALLAIFSLVTAVVYHNFWSFPGLFRPEGGRGLDELWEFLKNLALAGGLMFVVREGHWSRQERK